ncbi:MAG: ATP-binding protein [Flavobacteriales bacterium]|nr:ATP-binding protein [Flavobacteriales bacterium]
MKFTTEQITVNSKFPIIYLYHDNWDDFGYKTVFHINLHQSVHDYKPLGAIRIGELDLERGAPNIPSVFETLPDNFFSLGTDEKYYREVMELESPAPIDILTALRDIAYDEKLYDIAIDHDVTIHSLLRSVSKSLIEDRFRKIIDGFLDKMPFSFRYTSPQTNKQRLSLTFSVVPKSNPPTNLHVIVGSNGVGKTHLLRNIVNVLKRTGSRYGSLEFGQNQQFASLVFVSFSAFDRTIPEDELKDKTKSIPYYYIGLKKTSSKNATRQLTKSNIVLENEFHKGIDKCLSEKKDYLLEGAFLQLYSDPIFAHANPMKLFKRREQIEANEFKKECKELFKELSSGHKIVLLTITRLVDSLADKSLVLIDEPEAHLHPPLLSAFIKSLSDLLSEKNAAAIVATHSPVVLQEVPKSSVWLLRRSGLEASAERLPEETYGENIGTLTNRVFGLEVRKSGYHKFLSDAIKDGISFDYLMKLLNDQLGLQGKAMAMTLINLRDKSSNEKG